MLGVPALVIMAAAGLAVLPAIVRSLRINPAALLRAE